MKHDSAFLDPHGPMPLQSCPACDRPAPRFLEGASSTAFVDYHLCEGCRHIWTTLRDTGALYTHVTRSSKKLHVET